MRKLGGNIRNWMVLGALWLCAHLPAFAVPYNGCPDFMDLDASYVDLFTGETSQPFDSIGKVEKRHHLNEEQGVDLNTGGKLKYIPDGELKSVRLGNDSIGGESEAIVYHYIVDSDNSLLFVNFAVVLEDPGHEFIFQPRFVIRITDKEGKLVNDCSEYDVSAAAGLEGFQDYQTMNGMVRWRDWTRIGLDLSPFVGQEVQVQFITYDCFMLGHFGYAYFTASCAPNKLAVESCSGSSFSLAAPEGFASYHWDNGDTTRVTTRTMSGGDMNIYCEVTSVTGCQFTQSAYISDNSIVISTDLKDTICQGDVYQRNYFDLPPQMNVGTFGYNNIIVNPSSCSSSEEVNLQLTVLQTYYPVVAAICEGEDYEENGFYVQHPPVGVYTDTIRLKHANGRCDSIICLRLEVSESNHLSNEIIGDMHPCVNSMVTYYVEVEDNLSRYLWTLPENVMVVSGANSPQIVLYFTDDKPATLELTGVNGCGSSAVPVKVYPRPSYHQVIADTICQGASYSLGDIRLGKQNTPGFFTSTHSYTTKAGCDSSIVLMLTVLPNPQATLEVKPDKAIFCDSAEVRLTVKTDGSQSFEQICNPLPAAIGDVYCEDGSILPLDSFLITSDKKAAGVVYFVDDSLGIAYIVSLTEKTDVVWSREFVDIPGIENQMYLRNLLADMDGYSHTSLMRNQGNATLYPMAWGVDLENGWYIPAIGELRKLFGAVDLVNRSIKQLGGSVIYEESRVNPSSYNVLYASSTEYSSQLACCVTSEFKLYAMAKMNWYRCRATRTVKLANWEAPKYRVGDLIENSDGSKGVVCYLAPDGKSGTMVALYDTDTLAMTATSSVSSSLLKSAKSIEKSLTEWSGYENTKIFRNMENSPAANAIDFENGWYIPSIAQLNYLYANSILLDSSLICHGGDPISYETYWSSTFYGTEEQSSYGWYCDMAQGNMVPDALNLTSATRPMRDFSYCNGVEVVVDSTCTYKWSTGDTVPTIVVRPKESMTYRVEVAAHQGKCSTNLSKDIYVKSDEPVVMNRTICAGRTYKDEYFEVSESGTYTEEVDNGDCKQTVVLNLEVLPAMDTTMLQDVICQGAIYQKHGFNFKANYSGVIYDTITLSSVHECDSVLCLRLEVLPAQRDTQYARVCQNEPYRENGFDIPAFQRAMLKYWERTDQSSDGCMMIHTLGLHVDTVYQIAMVDSACYMERYQKNGFDFLVDEHDYSLHYLTLRSSVQCDSVIALRLKALEQQTYTYYDTVMYGESYRDANFVLPAQKVAGTHTFDTTYVAANGCDSLVVLDLYVRGDDEVSIPTSFTPNDGNGVNDIFMEGYEIYIYDRYGLLVAHTNNGWDGTYRGAPADAGVYIYTIRFKNGKEKHGTVEIIKE